MDSITTTAGNLCAPVELRYTGTGKAVANLRIARNRPINQTTGKRPPAEFITVVVWEDMAENMAEVPVGARIIVFGELRSRNYEKQDGTTAYVTELVARDIGVSAKWNPVQSSFVPNGQRQSAAPSEGPTEGELELPEGFGS